MIKTVRMVWLILRGANFCLMILSLLVRAMAMAGIRKKRRLTGTTEKPKKLVIRIEM